MLEPFDFQEPLFINTVGHATGVLLFAVFLWLFWQDRQRAGERAWLPATTASLALLWNLGSLLVLAASYYGWAAADPLAALAFSVLSLLPALLLDLFLHGRWPAVRWAGYTCSAVAVVLHVAELRANIADLHHAALLLITLGFGILTVLTMFLMPGRIHRHSHLLVSMCLLLFSASFLHFGGGYAHQAWSTEIAWHHAGIPLALLVLLQDYRFLLLDAFLRFFVNGLAAALFTTAAVFLNGRFHILASVKDDPWREALFVVAVCLALLLFSFCRQRLQRALTHRVFHRLDPELIQLRLQQTGTDATDEEAFVDGAAQEIARFFGADHAQLIDAPQADIPTTDGREALVPLHVAGDSRAILLGPRYGRRRYLSEDLALLGKLAALLTEQIERFRRREVEQLVTQAELRALQAQINPHFLFNSLNTLYGTIARENAEARRLVLNLSDLFRYFLQSDKTFRPLADELRIIEAYLEIESLRLGDRLRTEIHVDPEARAVLIPMLLIQPLVENAVKHGVAAQPGGGVVRLLVRAASEGLQISVEDSGPGFRGAASDGAGVGLDNVRRRLQLCYGSEAALSIRSREAGTTVEFLVPQAAAIGSRH